MDVRDIGNLFMIGFHGTYFSTEVRDMLEELNPCGVILFARNIEEPGQIAALNHDLQSHGLRHGGAGYFVGVDQEGGRVRRLKEPFAYFPPALQLAAAAEPESTVAEAARITARQLRLVGFNLDFVPVLDVLTAEDAHSRGVIGDRSFGHDPACVARLGTIVIEQMRAEGVIPCCKHFPGHGGTSVDSHTDLPVDPRALETLRGCDLVPFQAATRRGVEMVMTAHVLYPSIDPELPATLSPHLVEGLLRKEMGYSGVVITDDLDMGAVAGRFGPGECSLRALVAGVDILLICNAPEKAFAARSRLMDALADGELSERRVTEALSRISTLKQTYRASMKPCTPENALASLHAV
jgi:beta-N-acetylhexosaminidase